MTFPELVILSVGGACAVFAVIAGIDGIAWSIRTARKRR